MCFFCDVITRTLRLYTLHLHRHLLNNSHFQVLAVALFGAVAADAEADADAFYGYYGYAAHPYAYGYYGYPYAYGHYAHYGKSAPCVNAANVPVPCQHGYSALAAPAVYGGYHHAGYYGKRSAEAEPEAEAYYGSYGYSAYSPVYSGYSSYSRPVYTTSYARPVYSGYGYSRLGYGYHY